MQFEQNTKVKRLAWATNPTRYTLLCRRKGSRRWYRYGLYSYSRSEMAEMAEVSIRSGIYAGVKLINADTNEEYEKFM